MSLLHYNMDLTFFPSLLITVFINILFLNYSNKKYYLHVFVLLKVYFVRFITSYIINYSEIKITYFSITNVVVLSHSELIEVSEP
jgi:hypothetical protein